MLLVGATGVAVAGEVWERVKGRRKRVVRRNVAVGIAVLTVCVNEANEREKRRKMNEMNIHMNVVLIGITTTSLA